VSLLACRAEPANVVFICEHGAAKSVMAAALFNKAAEERGLRVRAIARGADPQAEPSKATVAGLRDDGLIPLPERPLALTGADVRGSKHIVVFDCPSPAMKPLASLGTCWDDVPAVSDGYPSAKERVQVRVAALVNDL
jgi:protein-tyrosine-phosphatase